MAAQSHDAGRLMRDAERDRRPERPPTVDPTHDSLRTAIARLDSRIAELKSFDVNSIRERWDPRVDALTRKTDGTFPEIFGHGTVEYEENSIDSLDTLPLVVGSGPDPLPLVIAGYRKGWRSHPSTQRHQGAL